MEITIKKSLEPDLHVFFRNQTDEEANYMAAFTPKDPHDEKAYLEKWRKLMHVDTVNIQSILVQEEVIGCVVKFEIDGDAEITYALDKKYWGKGITTFALKKFLELESCRPIYGRVAFDNIGSQKILEKSGFVRIGEDKGFANARGKEIQEFIYKLS